MRRTFFLSLFDIIKSLRFEVYNHDKLTVLKQYAWLCDIICILQIFMQGRCAFSRALMLSLKSHRISVQFTITIHLIELDFFCDYLFLFCIIFLSINMYRASIQLGVFLLALVM